MLAKPKKLRDGTWGAVVESTNVREGVVLTVQTRAGKTWQAEVTRVVWSGNGASICKTVRSGGGSRDSYGNRIGDGSSYQAGVTAPGGRRCPECGGRECSKAWDRHDLCDED